MFNIGILFPNLLEEVHIENCKFEEIPSLLGNLKSFEVLRIGCNPIIFEAYEFSTTPIEVLVFEESNCRGQFSFSSKFNHKSQSYLFEF